MANVRNNYMKTSKHSETVGHIGLPTLKTCSSLMANLKPLMMKNLIGSLVKAKSVFEFCSVLE